MKDIAIFDLGNVLFRWDPIWIAEELAFPGFVELTRSLHWIEFDRGVKSHVELAKSYDTRLDPSRLTKVIERAVTFLEPISVGFELFRSCQKQGKKIYILSNMPTLFKSHLLASYEELSMVQGALYSCDCGYVKPEEEIYRLLLKTYSLDPERCLFFDDLAINIEAASRLGIQGVVFDRHKPHII